MTLSSLPRLGRWPTRLAIAPIVVCSAPALLSFGTHLFEHWIPLGFSCARLDGPALSGWVAWSLLWSALHCTVSTWVAVALTGITVTLGRLNWLGRSALVLFAALAYISMRDMSAILHSCWGEAPHFPWCILC
jgi:hypothetical protein